MPIQASNIRSVFDEVKEAIPSCAATPEELLGQRDRQARLAPAVTSIERTEEAVTISFARTFDRTALEETVEVERRCCPFFLFDFDDHELRLTISVREPEQRPALAALASAFESDREGGAV